jgi:hypothetical protein
MLPTPFKGTVQQEIAGVKTFKKIPGKNPALIVNLEYAWKNYPTSTKLTLILQYYP